MGKDGKSNSLLKRQCLKEKTCWIIIIGNSILVKLNAVLLIGLKCLENIAAAFLKTKMNKIVVFRGSFLDFTTSKASSLSLFFILFSHFVFLCLLLSLTGVLAGCKLCYFKYMCFTHPQSCAGCVCVCVFACTHV